MKKTVIIIEEIIEKILEEITEDTHEIWPTLKSINFKKIPTSKNINFQETNTHKMRLQLERRNCNLWIQFYKITRNPAPRGTSIRSLMEFIVWHCRTKAQAWYASASSAVSRCEGGEGRGNSGYISRRTTRVTKNNFLVGGSSFA